MMLDSPTLTGRFVELRQLRPDDDIALLDAASRDRTTYGLTMVPDSAAAMARYITTLLEGQARGSVVPFVQIRRSDGELLGCTRFMELQWWASAEAPVEVEIGGTWLTAAAQRTPINTEAKLLLLTHAFEVWDVQRACLCTDARNERSRAAIERIGASFEGILRSHRPSTATGEQGRARNSAMFSIVAAEWPAVKQQLEHRLPERFR